MDKGEVFPGEDIPAEIDPKRLIVQEGPHQGQIADKWLAQEGFDARLKEAQRLDDINIACGYDPEVGSDNGFILRERAKRPLDEVERRELADSVRRKATQIIDNPDGTNQINNAAVNAEHNFLKELDTHGKYTHTEYDDKHSENVLTGRKIKRNDDANKTIFYGELPTEELDNEQEN